jgi:hypothetical protein
LAQIEEDDNDEDPLKRELRTPPEGGTPNVIAALREQGLKDAAVQI